MDKVRLGKTELMVSRLSFGGLPIQSVDRDSAEKVARYAYDRGMNFFDTARGYTTSEADLGRALAGLGEKVIIATKSYYKNMEQLDKDFKISIKNLNRDYIDLFQFHIVNYEKELQAILEKGGPLDYLKERQREGRLRHIGITSHRPAMMLQALKTGAFETVQIPLNYIETEPLDKLIPLAASLDIGVIAMKPVAGGVFTSNRAAVKWVLQQQGVVPIPGMCRIEEVDDNLAALNSPLTPEELAALESDKQELGTIFCRRCDYCMPCPNDIEASYIVRSGMIFKRVGWDKMEQDHIDAFVKGLTCDQCGTCASRCPYDLPLTDMVIDESLAMLRKAVEYGKLSEEDYNKILKDAGKNEPSEQK
ncbi:MAG: aldo/keto reductase [Firmicutes bacterium]|nr:aldo/keto reductase [Bacillota bacterium]